MPMLEMLLAGVNLGAIEQRGVCGALAPLHLAVAPFDHISASCAAAAPLGHGLALPTALAIAECRAEERELRAEEERRGLGLRAGFLV